MGIVEKKMEATKVSHIEFRVWGPLPLLRFQTLWVPQPRILTILPFREYKPEEEWQ